MTKTEWIARAEAAEARVKALEEALGPFAAVAQHLEAIGHENDDEVLFTWSDDDDKEFDVTLGDFRRARSTLTDKTND